MVQNRLSDCGRFLHFAEAENGECVLSASLRDDGSSGGTTSGKAVPAKACQIDGM